jgi:hypothetical protein
MPKETAIKYVVVEEGFSARRVVYGPTTDKDAADRVASQHAARSVIQSKGQ